MNTLSHGRMEYEDCSSDVEKSVCRHLLSTLASFEPYPHDKMIRLALTPPVVASLNLTIQHGPCAISCEGHPNGCNTTKEYGFWSDASTPFYISNCTPSHHYCITASIGECCPVCTRTVFLKDFQRECYNEDGFHWKSELIYWIALILLLFFLGTAVILKYYYNNGLRGKKQKSQASNDVLTQHILEIDKNQLKTQVVCLYLKERDPLFLDLVKSVQEFLRRKGIKVIDIHDEEENINRSVSKWVKAVVKEDTKVLLFDAENTRHLWNGDVGNKILTPLEQAVHFTRSYIPVTNVHSRLFVVRFLKIPLDTKTLIDLHDGRCYVYPVHKERLANDLR